ncbi:MAG: sugar ABC transporter permease [Christensenellaceae bacterium]|nr:sugar ABC transporter permease [Christensenellaceae bacterium]
MKCIRLGTRSASRGNFNQILAPLLFIAPAFLIFLWFIIVPAFQGLRMSFMDYGFFSESAFVGLDNFSRLMSDKVFWITVKNTIYYSLITVLLLTIFSLFSGLLLHDNALKGVKIFRASMYIPSLLSMITVGIAWRFILGDQMGIVNYLLRTFGHDGIQWLTSRKTAMSCVIFVSIWAQTGYYMVIMLSGLQAIPHELYEAAKIDGANSYKAFWHITLPLLKSTVLAVMVLATIASFKAYELISVMTQGGPGYSTKLIVQQIYQVAFTEDRLGYASSMSIVLMIIIGLFTLLQFRIVGSEYDYE